ncbi:MAG: porin family protein [Nitrososphaeraceae archaeon]|nr:porin family protein [Nitrososphaeraceae archaeon]
MKYLLISLVFLSFLIINSSYAQVNLYALGGVNMSNVKNYDQGPESVNGIENSGDLKLGWHIGGGAAISLSNKLSFNPELQFSSKGFREDAEPSGKLTISLIYLNTPLLIHYQLIDRFSVILGPELGIKLASRVRTNGFGSSANEFYDNLFDLGFTVGAAYKINEQMNLSLRFTHGFATVIKDLYYTDTGSGFEQIKFFNQNLQLSLSYDIFNRK